MIVQRRFKIKSFIWQLVATLTARANMTPLTWVVDLLAGLILEEIGGRKNIQSEDCTLFEHT